MNKGTGLIGVEGKGRAVTRQSGWAHGMPRSHDCLARAVDLELPVLRHWQHKSYDPYRCGHAHEGASPGLSIAHGRNREQPTKGPQADPGCP